MYTRKGKIYYSHQSLGHIDSEEKFKAFTREHHSSGEKRKSVRDSRDTLYLKQKLPGSIVEEEEDFTEIVKKRRASRGRDVRDTMYLKQKLPNKIREEEEEFVATAKKARVSRFVERDLTQVRSVGLETENATPGCELVRMEEILRVDGCPITPVPVEQRCEIKRMSGGRPKLPRARRCTEESDVVVGEVAMRGGEGGGLSSIGDKLKKVGSSMGVGREENKNEDAIARENIQNSRVVARYPSTRLATAGTSSPRSADGVAHCAHVEHVSILFHSVPEFIY